MAHTKNELLSIMLGMVMLYLSLIDFASHIIAIATSMVVICCMYLNPS